jgi:hypothetical protein
MIASLLPALLSPFKSDKRPATTGNARRIHHRLFLSERGAPMSAVGFRNRAPRSQ